MTSHEPKAYRRLTALTELGRDSVMRPTRAELDHGLGLLHARIAGRRNRQTRIVRVSLLGAVALTAILMILRWRGTSVSAGVLAYQIEGGRVLEGGYLRESGHTGVKLRFNEGSTFELMPGTRGRLRAVNREGTRVAVDSGTASFRITPSNEHRWWVESGPFVVTVKGTVFAVSWEPASERFELRLRQGSVSVSGPISGGDLTLRAGQRLVVNLSKAETLIAEDRPEAVVDSDAAAAPAIPQPSSTPSKGVASAASTVPAPSAIASVAGERRWAQELANGHWDHILEQVDRKGVDAALNGASSEDLLALADAARYRRRMDLARDALLAERRRFPNSPRAVDVLFLLGRVEESRGAGIARAIAWYDEYLARAPMGSYAAEAMGRKMIITKDTSGEGQARAIAEEYLRRFPKGSYAGTARALLRMP